MALDPRLAASARIKGLDMVRNGYFSHISPVYGSPFDIMWASGVSFTMGEENIAGNTSVEGAHHALMTSPGHRSNILNPMYTHVGIGVVDGGPYGKMITEQFARE